MISMITSCLFISDLKSACDGVELQRAGITHVINLSGRQNFYPVPVVVMNIDLDDHPSSRIDRHFESTNKFIELACQQGGRVLVHCMAGISRSSTIVASYLMYRYGFSPSKTLAFIRDRRAVICPNEGFRDQLNNYWRQVAL